MCVIDVALVIIIVYSGCYAVEMNIVMEYVKLYMYLNNLMNSKVIVHWIVNKESERTEEQYALSSRYTRPQTFS